ncbi:MAG: HTH domain-containing protein [Bacteroidales bacterium]|nr:HTH domain-containing protein [Bacteroidales bacterium]
MNGIEKLKTLAALEKLIRQECTGTPKQLARRLSISERTLYRKIEILKSHGSEIKFSRIRNTFYYSNDEVVDVHFSIKSTA